MAILSGANRREVWAQFMRKLSRLNEPLSIDKAQLRAAVDATDQWIENNAANFNSALPLPARAALTASQKVRLFTIVAERRFGVL